MITEFTEHAVEITQVSNGVVHYLRTTLGAGFAHLSESGDPQAVLDALGTKAALYLQSYALAREALAQVEALRAAAGIPSEGPLPVEPDFSIYQSNPDGTVSYHPVVVPPEG